MTPEFLRNVLESAMLAAGRALSLDDFLALFDGSKDAPDRAELRRALGELGESLRGRPLELAEVASGYRLQVRQEYSPWLGGLFAERPPRYSRALLETLALIAYRQPITRGEIEDVRGVAVSSNIIKTLMEREWIRVLGHREVPGRPALFGTTREFLDHFGLKSLDGLPPLAEIRDLEQVEPDLFAPMPREAGGEEGMDETPGHPEDAGKASDTEAAVPGMLASVGDETEGEAAPELVDGEAIRTGAEPGDRLAGEPAQEGERPQVAPDAAAPANDDRDAETETLELGGASDDEDTADAEGDSVIRGARREG